jgi:1-deoxy-D-xylulose-5-phosphate reductoisomerase
LKNIAILGSTGSVGTQAIQVVEAHPDQFNIGLLTSNTQGDLLISQALKFKPLRVVIGDKNQYLKVKEALKNQNTEVLAGNEWISQAVQEESIEVVLTALVGYCGLAPTIKAIEKGKVIALANKETLVVAGQLIMDLCKKSHSAIIPVDSEHSAIFQCLQGEKPEEVEKIILTASGGPFRGKSIEFLQTVDAKQALKHPNWSMGAKISIDSASMMNKGLEVIEAKWLFDLKMEEIEVVIHPQSVIHSMVQFRDGSIKAQLGPPDMRMPIHYALNFPKRIKSEFPRYNFLEGGNLTFEAPDSKTFRNLGLAYEALKLGGNMPCILNAANEMVVNSFLKNELSFLGMSRVIEKCMAKVSHIQNPGYEDYVKTDQEVRNLALEFVKSGSTMESLK